MMAKRVGEDGHIDKCDERREKVRCRRRRTRNRASIRVRKLADAAEEIHPSEWATLGAQKAPHMVCQTWHQPHFTVFSFQHGTMLHVDSHGATRQVPSTTSWNGGLAHSARSSQEGSCSKPSTPINTRAAPAASANVEEPSSCKDLTMERGHLWMTRPRVGPTGQRTQLGWCELHPEVPIRP